MLTEIDARASEAVVEVERLAPVEMWPVLFSLPTMDEFEFYSILSDAGSMNDDYDAYGADDAFMLDSDGGASDHDMFDYDVHNNDAAPAAKLL